MLNAADLPDDIAALKAMLVAAEARDQRKDVRIERLEKLVAAFRQAVFGHKSEKREPEQFRVIVTRRPKFACRACTDGVVQASAPARLIPGGLPTGATIAHVLVSKYADHLPLYRQA